MWLALKSWKLDGKGSSLFPDLPPHSEEIASDSFNQTRSGNEGENLKHLFQHFQLRHMSIYAYAYAGQYLVFFSISTLFCCNKISSLADQVDWAQRVTE